MTKAQKVIVIIVIMALLAIGGYQLFMKLHPREILRAECSGFMQDWKLSLYSDSTYQILVKVDMIYADIPPKTDTLKGKYYLKNDTLYFPGGIKNGKAGKATIKNNIIEFPGTPIDGLPIVETELHLKSAIDPKKYPDYVIYTYKPEYLEYFPIDSKPYDLTEKDIALLEKILKKQPANSLPGKCADVEKTCRAAITKKGHTEVFIECDDVAIIIDLTTGTWNRMVCLGG